MEYLELKARTYISILFLILSTEYLPAQNLQLIQNQWTAIQKAKSPEEKIMRNCRMSRGILGSDLYNYESNQLTQDVDLGQLDGFSDLMEEEGQIRIISWHLALSNNIQQYNLEYICPLKGRIGVSFSSGSGWCDNTTELDCDPCHSSSEIKNNWIGAYYESMTSSYQDSSLILHMKGIQFQGGDTNTVSHLFSVSPSCKIKFIPNGDGNAVK